MLKESPLGKTTTYIETYTPGLLFPVARSLGRDKAGITSDLPFTGADLWTAFEISWINPTGKPEVALAEFSFPHTSPNIVESKSFKLYLNSFNQSVFASIDEVEKIIQKDLKAATEGDVKVHLYQINQTKTEKLSQFPGICIDDIEIETQTYHIHPKFLKTSSEIVEETLHSNLLKSNCLATGQPDWASVMIRYKGKKIEHAGLLKYIISYRNHSGFHEHCVEQMFKDILTECHPEHLTVYARYTRRGGLDINPFRSNFEPIPANIRQLRQ